MRFILLAALLAGPVLEARSHADEAPSDEAYEAFVTADETDVLAGPSRRFYTTEKLPHGASVQVFRRDAGGFVAIRPPEGSFSWVSAEQVQMTGERNIGRIISAEAASWIGTSLERVREHQHHVQLKPGELVEVLGKRTVDGVDGEGEMWLKIAPPAGEFRWVRGDDLSREPPEPLSEPELQLADDTSRESSEVDEDAEPIASEKAEPRRISRPSGARPVPAAIASAEAETDDATAVEIDEPEDEPAPVKSRPTIRLTDLYASDKGPFKAVNYDPPADPTVDNSPAGDGFVPRKRKRLEPTPVPTLVESAVPSSTNRAPSLIRPVESGGFISRTSGTTSRPVASPAARSATTSARPLERNAFAEELDALEVDLALMLAQNKQLWNLAPLKQRGERLVEQGPTSAERGRARLVMDKIQEVQRTFDVPDLGVAGTTPAVTPATASAAPSPADPKYDGVGILKPVLGEGRPIAPFALVDREGNTLGYVTPGPGLNLNRYVDKEVGLYGRRGFIETLRLPHVTAQRVIDLDRHRR